GDLEALARPIVGYLGGLHQWVDQELIVGVASRMPDVTFALVGPAQTDVSALERCTNVRLFGQRSHETVPAYVKGFDVGIVPYRIAEYTLNVYPTKLNEYLVMGIPVVATDLPEIRRFNAQHGSLVGVASGPGSFSQAIRAALNDSTPPDVQRRIAAAHENSRQRPPEAPNPPNDETMGRRATTRQRCD